jgi:hypothetical protein
VPDLRGLGATHQEVVNIFIRCTVGAGCGGGAVVAESPLICAQASALGKPKKNPALQGGIAPPGSCCLFIVLQMPERIDIKISIQKLFVSGATQPNIWDAGKQRNRSYLRRERKEFSTGNRGKAGNTTSGDPVETGGGNGDICPCDMGEEGRETLGQRGVP